MNSKFPKEYLFDFNNTVNENFPLTFETLKLCRQEIKKVEDLWDGSILDKQIKIKLNVSHYNLVKSNPKPYSDILDNNVYEVSEKKRFNIMSSIRSTIGYTLSSIIYNIKFKFNLIDFKLDIRHYYLINNNIYVTYMDSFLLFESMDLYLKQLQKINDVKYKYLYRSDYFFRSSFSISSLIDSVILRSVLSIHLLYLKSVYKNRLDYRLDQTKWGFYLSSDKSFINSLLSGLKYIWLGLRFWLIGLFIATVAVYYLMYIRLLPFNKVVLSWLLLSMFFYWLVSGFVFFIKKYQYGRFTSSIQRFWKRTYIIFWIIEASTFSVFLYLTINATSEPVYMYDQAKIYKTHLFSWRWFLIKLLPSVAVILLSFHLQLTLKWNLFNKQNNIMLLITIILLYILWLEFYQFYHILSFFGSISWFFDFDEYIWTLDIDTRRTRLANNYVAICLFAKFWHFVFIFIFWIFFVLRSNELSRIRYPLLAANIQNFILIYIMSWVYMYPWFKFVFKKYIDVPYYWFFINGRELGLKVFLTDIKLFYYGLTNVLIDHTTCYTKYIRYPFYYWINSSPLLSYDQYRKSIIRDSIIHSFNLYI